MSDRLADESPGSTEADVFVQAKTAAEELGAYVLSMDQDPDAAARLQRFGIGLLGLAAQLGADNTAIAAELSKTEAPPKGGSRPSLPRVLFGVENARYVLTVVDDWGLRGRGSRYRHFLPDQVICLGVFMQDPDAWLTIAEIINRGFKDRQDPVNTVHRAVTIAIGGVAQILAALTGLSSENVITVGRVQASVNRYRLNPAIRFKDSRPAPDQPKARLTGVATGLSETLGRRGVASSSAIVEANAGMRTIEDITAQFAGAYPDAEITVGLVASLAGSDPAIRPKDNLYSDYATRHIHAALKVHLGLQD